MEIFQCGIMVSTKLGKIEAIITAVLIRFGRIQYELSYIYNGEYKTMWMDECEFDIKSDLEKAQIGFK
jgi:hypothetical protein